MLLGAPTLPV